MTRENHILSPGKLAVLSHKIRWQILQVLAKEEQSYAKYLAELLNVSESKVHYHLNILREAGIIVPLGEKSVKHGKVKLFGLTAQKFTLSVLNGEIKSVGNIFTDLFSTRFSTRGKFQGKIIVGSAEPHGKYDALSRDGFLAGELCWYLGRHYPLQAHVSIPHFVITDVEYKLKYKKPNHSLISIGGPITNIITEYYNEVLKAKFGVYFFENRIRHIDKEYSKPTNGIISLIKDQNHWILILAGVRSLGTQAAIYTIVSDCYEMIVSDNEFITIFEGKSFNDKEIIDVKSIMTLTPEG